MIPSLIRILLLGALGYGLYTVVPVIAPVIQENLGSAEVSNLSVVKKSQEYLSKLSGGEVAVTVPRLLIVEMRLLVI